MVDLIIGRSEVIKYRKRPIRYLRDLKGFYNMLEKSQEIMLDSISTGGDIIGIFDEDIEGNVSKLTIEKVRGGIQTEEEIDIGTRAGQLKLEKEFIQAKDDVEEILEKYKDKGNSFKIKKMDKRDKVVLSSRVNILGELLDLIILMMAAMVSGSGIKKPKKTAVDAMFSHWTY